MAGPTVTLEFAGDSAKLEKAFDGVGQSAKGMSTEVGKSARSFDSASNSADTFDTRSMGVADTLTGVQDTSLGLSEIMKGNLFEGSLLAAQGFSDLGSGLVNFMIPALQRGVAWLAQTRVGTLAVAAAQRVAAAATVAWTFAQRILNVVLRANPIGLVITALFAIGAALVLAWNKSETFRRIVIGVWNAVKAGALAMWNGIRTAWNNVVSFVGGAIRGIKGFLSGMWDGIVSGAKSAINAAINFINGAIRGINTVTGAVGIPGIPQIPNIHTGGTVPGAPGEETLMRLQAGERVTRAGASPKTVLLRSDGSALSTLIMDTLRAEVRRLGGNVQFVIGA